MHINWWTLALQTVNVLILIWLLARFFLRPVANIVAERQEKAAKLLSDAAAAERAARAARADADGLREQIAADRGRVMAEAQKAERAEREQMLARTSEEIAKLRHDATVAIARDQAAAEEALLARAGDLAVEIARRLVARLPQPLPLGAFVDGLCAQLRSLPPEIRQQIASAGGEQPVAVVSSSQLADEDAARLRAELAALFGADVSITFRADESLLAGLELRSRNAVVSNSWRADLERISRELRRAPHHRET